MVSPVTKQWLEEIIAEGKSLGKDVSKFEELLAKCVYLPTDKKEQTALGQRRPPLAKAL